MEITVIQQTIGLYNVYINTEKLLGTFEIDVDGFYYFWDNKNNNGCWSSHSLRLIADKLDEHNKPYRNSIEEYFKQENEKRDSCEHDFILVEDFCGMLSYACKNCGYEIANLSH